MQHPLQREDFGDSFQAYEILFVFTSSLNEVFKDICNATIEYSISVKNNNSIPLPDPLMDIGILVEFAHQPQFPCSRLS